MSQSAITFAAFDATNEEGTVVQVVAGTVVDIVATIEGTDIYVVAYVDEGEAFYGVINDGNVEHF